MRNLKYSFPRNSYDQWWIDNQMVDYYSILLHPSMNHDHSFFNHQKTCKTCDRPIFIQVVKKLDVRRHNKEFLKKLVQDSPSTSASVPEGQEFVHFDTLDKEQDNHEFGSPEDLPEDHNSMIQIDSMEASSIVDVQPLEMIQDDIQKKIQEDEDEEEGEEEVEEEEEEEEEEERKPKGQPGPSLKIGKHLKNYYPDMWRWIRNHTYDHSLLPNSSSQKAFPTLIKNYWQQAYEYLTIQANRPIPRAVPKKEDERTNHCKEKRYQKKSQKLLDKYFGKQSLPL